jgi:hypothetical protein
MRTPLQLMSQPIAPVNTGMLASCSQSPLLTPESIPRPAG